MSPKRGSSTAGALQIVNFNASNDNGKEKEPEKAESKVDVGDKEKEKEKKKEREIGYMNVSFPFFFCARIFGARIWLTFYFCFRCLHILDDSPVMLRACVAMIDNPSNANEILLMEKYNKSGQAHILIYNKQERTFTRTSVIPFRFTERKGVKVVKSNSNKDHIIFAMPQNHRLWYSIFDCKSYKWVCFSENRKYIDTFFVPNGAYAANKNNYQKLRFYPSSTMIAVGNYLIFIHGCDLDILDISNEMVPVHMYHSRIHQRFYDHGCVRLPNDSTNTSIRLLLFGGREVEFEESIYVLELRFKILTKSESNEKYPYISQRENDTLYTGLNGTKIKTQIKLQHVPWKCYGITSHIFVRFWYNFLYEWQNQGSDLILGR